MMEKVNILINDILKNWNPLDVPLEIAEDEYSTYFPMILKHTQNPNSVYSCLKKILKDSMDMEFSDYEDIELRQIARRIYEIAMYNDTLPK